jgi:hypothetical protein
LVVNVEMVTTPGHSSITSFMTKARVLVAVTSLLVMTGSARADDWTAKLLARTDDIAKEISTLRGLKIKKPIKRDVMDHAGLRQRLLTRFAEELTAADLAAEQLALERWGLVPHGTSIHDVMVDVLAEQIAGFYDPVDKTLYIASEPSAGDADTESHADMLMAHEIVHALQDQHFDLEKLMDLSSTEGDALLARQALVEGDGMVSMFELQLARQDIPPPWGMDDAVAMMMKTMEGSDAASSLGRAPLVVRDLLLFPYSRGLRFVASMRATRPWKKVDDIFKKPPASTEQILHPELYLAGEEPIAIKEATPAVLQSWTRVHETVWGEAGWSVLLRQHGVDSDRARDAAAGWGGDRVVVYGRGGAARDAVGVGRTTWDADIDAMEFAEAAIQAVESLVTGTIVESGKHRTVWLGTDARVSIVERRDDQVLVVVGAPLTARDVIADDVWKSWKVAG